MNDKVMSKIRGFFHSRYIGVNMLRIFSILLVMLLLVIILLSLSGVRGSSKTMEEVSAPVIRGSAVTVQPFFRLLSSTEILKGMLTSKQFRPVPPSGK